MLTINQPQLNLILFEAECSFYDKWPVLTINDHAWSNHRIQKDVFNTLLIIDYTLTHTRRQIFQK